MKKKLLSFLSLMVIAIFAFAATKGLQKADDAETFKVGISEGIKNAQSRLTSLPLQQVKKSPLPLPPMLVTSWCLTP